VIERAIAAAVDMRPAVNSVHGEKGSPMANLFANMIANRENHPPRQRLAHS